MSLDNKPKHSLDDYKDVMHVLRHKCSGVKSYNSALKIIIKETGFDEEKVNSILSDLYGE